MRYYHGTSKRLKRMVLRPEGFYERVDGDCPDPIYSGGEYVGYPTSDVKESCFSKTIEGAAASIASRCVKGERCAVHVYGTDEEPDIDISDCDGDFGIIEEVRYRRPVPVRFVKTLTIPPRTVEQMLRRAERHDEYGYNPESWGEEIRWLKKKLRRRKR